MSKSQADRFGLSDPKEAIGKTDFDFFTEEHARPAFEDEQRIIRTGQPIVGIEEKETWPDGGISWVSTTKMPLLDEKGEIIGTFGISRDITERKIAEEQLLKAMEEVKNSEDKLKNIINGSAIPQFFIDEDHKVVYWNTALTELTGIKAEEIVGTSNHWKAFYQEQRPCLADLLVEGNIKNLPEWYSDKYQKSHLVENGFEATEFFPNLGKDGKWLFFTAVAIKNSKGEIIGSLETLEDITESKRAEEQREKFIAELQEALDKIKTLKGLIPICACCKKIRDDQGYWNSVESYIKDHAEVEFTHGICPDCMKKLYPNYCKDDNDKKEA